MAFTRTGARCWFAIEAVRGHDLAAVYAIGPGIDRNEPSEWSRRIGHIVGREMVFAQKHESTLRFRPREDGGMAVTWISPDGKTKMDAGLRRIDGLDLLPGAAAR